MSAPILVLGFSLIAGAAALYLRPAGNAEAPVAAPASRSVEDGGTVVKRFGALTADVEWKGASADTFHNLVELAVLRGLWPEAATFAETAVQRDPASERAEGARIAAAFFPALAANDREAAEPAFQKALARLRDRPDDTSSALVAIYWFLHENRGADALPLIDAAILREPQFYEYDELRLAALQRMGDVAATGEQLFTLHRKYPDRSQVTTWLVEWLVGQGRIEDASEVLFDAAQRAAAPEGPISEHVAFLRAHMQDAAAEAEIERLVSTHPVLTGAEQYQSALAQIEFDLGRVQKAIVRMQSVAYGDGPDAIRADAGVRLAAMLESSGDRQGARREIDALLLWDVSNPEARKMRARWLIESGDFEAALTDLWGAAAGSKDAGLALLLGEAYLLRGSSSLAGQQFAMAFDYSDAGTVEAVRFSDFLVSNGQLEVADRVLRRALSARPDDISLLERALRVSSAIGDEVRTAELAERLRFLGTTAGSRPP